MTVTTCPYCLEDIDLDQCEIATPYQMARFGTSAEADSPDAYVRRILYTRSIDTWRRTRREPVASEHVGSSSASAPRGHARVAR